MDRKDKIEQNRYKWISRKDKMDIIDNNLVIAKKDLKLMGSGKRKELKLSKTQSCMHMTKQCTHIPQSMFPHT
jgi:hypothetical protein